MPLVTRRTFAASLGTALAAACLAWAAPARAAEEPFGRLSVDEVEKLLGQKDVRIIDVNDQEVFAKAHVPGAVRVDLTEVAGALPADKALKLVYYCKNGH
jgi:3-mercaptopyruvate sulfurtransferase SseA